MSTIVIYTRQCIMDDCKQYIAHNTLRQCKACLGEDIKYSFVLVTPPHTHTPPPPPPPPA